MIPIKVDISEDYKAFYANAFIDYIENRSTKYSVGAINNCINSIFNGVISNFEELLLASPSKLKELIDVYNLQSNKGQKRVNDDLDLMRMYDVFCSNELNYKDSNYGKLNPRQHYEFLGFEVCPYCNQNPIASLKRTKRITKPKRTYDWDHFFPKEHYKFLSISLFNLIPSCKACNSLKLNSISSYLNPFEKYKVNELLEFYIQTEDIRYLETSNNFNIDKVADLNNPLSRKLDNLVHDLFLIERYLEHKSFLRIQFKKYRKYNSSWRKSQRKLLSFVQKDVKKNAFENYFGLPIEENEFMNIPYSKLLYDVIYNENIKE